MRPPRRCESDQCGGFLRSPKEVMVNRIYLLPTFFAFMLATAFTCSAETVNVKMKSSQLRSQGACNPPRRFSHLEQCCFLQAYRDVGR